MRTILSGTFSPALTLPRSAPTRSYCADVIEPPSHEWNFPKNKLTSKIVCDCIFDGEAWGSMAAQNFDNVLNR